MIHLLHLKNVPIFEQLRLEEALLRLDKNNWCLLNEGSPRAIVMGVSGKEHELVDIKQLKKAKIPLIRRFSGGGAVIVDENTVFATFICQKELHEFPPFPERILQWSAEFYRQALQLPTFVLRENDYALDHLKCGGNAQYLRKDRWLHHTTFLWDFEDANMSYLFHPKKTPKYREGRSHLEFLCRLKDSIPSKEETLIRIKEGLKKRYQIKTPPIEEVLLLTQQEHRHSTHYVLL